MNRKSKIRVSNFSGNPAKSSMSAKGYKRKEKTPVRKKKELIHLAFKSCRKNTQFMIV